MSNFFMIVKFELKKILSRKLVWVLFGITILITSYILLNEMIGYIGDVPAYEFEQLNRQACEVVEDMVWNEENYDEIIKTITAEENLPAFRSVYSLSPIEWYKSFSLVRNDLTYEDFEYNRENMQAANFDELELTDSEIVYWYDKGKGTEDITLGYMVTYRTIVTSLHLITMLFILLISFALCTSFSSEHTLRTDALNLCTKNGRVKLFFARFLAGEIFAVSCSVILCVFSFVLTSIFYGTDGFNLPVQLCQIETLYPLTMGKFMLICYGLLILSGIMTSGFVMLMSEAFKSPIPSLAVIFATVVMAFINSGDAPRTILQILSYLPILRVGQLSMTDERLVMGMNALQFSFILYSGLTLIFVFICEKFYKRYQVQGK